MWTSPQLLEKLATSEERFRSIFENTSIGFYRTTPEGKILIANPALLKRLDGSGYPQGLQAGEILLEARILGVADVVEAMASYRPYRLALGIDAALAEIEEGKNILYAPDVVKSCLDLFRQEGYELDGR